MQSLVAPDWSPAQTSPYHTIIIILINEPPPQQPGVYAPTPDEIDTMEGCWTDLQDEGKAKERFSSLEFYAQRKVAATECKLNREIGQLQFEVKLLNENRKMNENQPRVNRDDDDASADVGSGDADVPGADPLRRRHALPRQPAA